MADDVLFDAVDGHDALIVISRAGRRDTTDAAVRRGPREGPERFAFDAALQAAVPAGTGERAFGIGTGLGGPSAAGVGGLRGPCSP